jgi:uncharacterized circularly permuted ATP-grasp superfamily protein/uncharacterized alpha-E superfamily protein
LAGGTVALPAAGGLFSNYVAPAGLYDELKAADGTLRPNWQRFVRGLENLGPQVLQQRAEQARRLLRENGVTYNAYGAPDPHGDRPWELDLIPLLFHVQEWAQLATALTQRVTLLNRMLGDLYGPQDLLRQGVLPPKLVYGHPGFLLPCHGILPPQKMFLHLYAGHLARQPDGRWIVLADRTQGPSGAGYALENRLVVSRVLPSDFESLHVERLAGFFIALRETLFSLAPHDRDNPRVVLLSPGPRSGNYFEDVYLARYLGFTLVEGGDLTVRGTRVFLKTLGGLLPVDVILRRTPDDESDPLELRADSPLGVTGLVQAARSGQVAIANALGSGVLEAPAMMAFLPAICRHLLEEELLLPSVPTWWCGDSESMRYVESHFDDLIIRPAFLHRSERPVLAWELSKEERDELLGRIRQRPGQFVAQSRVERSSAPVWTDGAPHPWYAGLRTFAAATPAGYKVMPGGLSRVSASADALNESAASGQGSKDVWVLADRPVAAVSLLGPPRTAVELRRSANDLPSRVADNLFWLGRYVERAEGMVRHLRSIVLRLTSELEPGGLVEVSHLVKALSDDAAVEPISGTSNTAAVIAAMRKEAVSFLLDTTHVRGLYQTLEALHLTASIVRDRISVDSWRIVNQLNLDNLVPWSADRVRLNDVLLLLNQMLNYLSAFSGLGMESMTRGAGWMFLDIGRRIERTIHTLALIERTLVPGDIELLPILEAVLEIADSSMTYRYRYLTSLQLAPVLDLLISDETNPRAVAFQLMALSDHVRNLPNAMSPLHGKDSRRIMILAQTTMRLTDVEALCEIDSHGTRASLLNFVEQLSDHMRQLSDSITHAYLAHAGPVHQLSAVFPMRPK